MPERSDAGAWLSFATDDLAAAHLLLANNDLPPRLSCFHAQQAAEKAIKALLVQGGIAFRRTHDLVVLAAILPENLRDRIARVDLQLLQQWAVDARYPADLPESSREDAATVLAAAVHVVAVVTQSLSADREA